MSKIHSDVLDNDAYQGLSAREEADLEKLMEQSEFTIHNARAFTEQLSKEVSQMDALNIQSLMASEQRVEALIKNLEEAISETIEAEKKIENYKNLLKNVKDIVFKVQQKEALVQIEKENNRKLLIQLESLINNLNFSSEYEKCLKDGEISSEKGIKICLNAANSLSDCLNAQIHPALNYLEAVREQTAKLENIQFKFAKRVSYHIENEYNYSVKEYGDNLLNNINSNDLILPSHEVIHTILQRYSSLMKWLKDDCPECFKKLQRSYVHSVKPIYEREILQYFEVVREKLSGNKNTLSSQESSDSKRKGFSVASEAGRMSSSSLSANLQEVSDSISRSSDLSLTEWEEFDSCFERMLSAFDPYCLSEQTFCINFFNIESNIGSFIGHRRNLSWGSTGNSISPSPSNPSQSSTETNDTKKSEALKKIMSDLFSVLEPEFVKFVTYYDKIDGLYSMYLLVRLTQHVLSTQDTGSFLATTYGTILIQVKRNFDRFMNIQKTGIEESKVPKRQKCGLLPFVKNFEQFAKQAEGVFKTGRRTDIDRWYVILIRSIFEAINRLAQEHPKTPPEIIELENYHYLHGILRNLKIACLENETKETKERYNKALKDYVSKYFARPLEKLNTFFEGVQMKVSQGVKMEEVGYQLAYSKQELRKVIKDCNLKEVRKGLEEMYRKVEKHVCEPDSTLIQVIWRSMQEEFISQYKALQDMIERCYPDANIAITFSIDDILQVFSDIALSH